MTTIKQELALEKTVENGGNISQAMRDVGYSESTINNPSNLTKSKGFLDLCNEKGLTDDLLINALIEVIKQKKGNRRAELELAFKIKGKFIEVKNIIDNDLTIKIQQFGSGIIMLPPKEIEVPREVMEANGLQYS